MDLQPLWHYDRLRIIASHGIITPKIMNHDGGNVVELMDDRKSLHILRVETNIVFESRNNRPYINIARKGGVDTNLHCPLEPRLGLDYPSHGPLQSYSSMFGISYYVCTVYSDLMRIWTWDPDTWDHCPSPRPGSCKIKHFERKIAALV